MFIRDFLFKVNIKKILKKKYVDFFVECGRSSVFGENMQKKQIFCEQPRSFHKL